MKLRTRKLRQVALGAAVVLGHPRREVLVLVPVVELVALAGGRVHLRDQSR
jgi:hypothetical protein